MIPRLVLFGTNRVRRALCAAATAQAQRV